MPTRKIDLSKLTGNIDDELIKLNREPIEKDQEPLSSEKPKRKRGRPRKNPLPKEEPAPVFDLYDNGEESDPDQYEQGFAMFDPEPEDPEARKRKVNKIGIIHELRKKLNAVGSGMQPHIDHNEDDLNAEIELLNSEINARRGDAAVKQITLMLMPLIEQIVDRMVPKDKCDVTGLQKEVHDNWEILDEACKHISILHRDWFEVSPYAEWAKGVYTCAFSRNMKNQMQRRRMTERQDDNSDSDEE